MTLTCRIFGHLIHGTRGPLYGRAEYRGRDGLGTVHMAVIIRCQRCNANYTAAMLHSDRMPFEKPQPERPA